MKVKLACMEAVSFLMPTISSGKDITSVLWMSLFGALIRVISDPNQQVTSASDLGLEIKKKAYQVILLSFDVNKSLPSLWKPFLPQLTRCFLKGLLEPVLMKDCLTGLKNWIVPYTVKMDMMLNELLLVCHHYVEEKELSMWEMILSICHSVWDKQILSSTGTSLTLETKQAWRDVLNKIEMMTAKSHHASIQSILDLIKN